MRSVVALVALAVVAVPGLVAGQTVGQPPEVGVYTSTGEATTEATVEKMRDLFLVVSDAEDGLSEVTGVSLEGGHLAAAVTLSTIRLPVPIAKALQVSISSGEEHFQIVEQNCAGKGLAEPGLAGDSCAVTVRAIPVDNATFSGTLSVKTVGTTFNVPLEVSASNLAPATLSISNSVTCPVHRTQEKDCGLFQIANTGFFSAKRFQIVKAGPNPDLFTVTHTCGDELQPGASCSLQVTASNLIESGTYSADISLGFESLGTGSWVSQRLSTEVRTATATVTGLDPAKLVVAADRTCEIAAPETGGLCGVFSVQNESYYSALALAISVDDGQGFTLVHDCPDPLPQNTSCNVRVTVDGFSSNETRVSDLVFTHQSDGAGSWGDTTHQAAKSTGEIAQVTATATGWLPEITITGNGSNMNIIGPGDPAYGGNRTLTLTNVGYVPADAMEVTLTNGNNFEFVSNPCQGATVPPQGTCQVAVRSKAKKDGAFSGSLQVAYNGDISTFELSGSATNMWSYEWQVASWGSCSAVGSWSGWSSCSAECGSGTQTRACTPGTGAQSRSVTCLRDDGTTVDDSYCETAKPADSQSCTSGCTGSASQSCTNICTYTITCQHSNGTQRSWSATGTAGTWTSGVAPSGAGRWGTRIENHSLNVNCLNPGVSQTGFYYVSECGPLTGNPTGRTDVISWCRTDR